MKALPILILIFMIGCSSPSNKSNRQLSKIKANDIEAAEVKRHFADDLAVKLNSQQIEKLVKWVNTTKNAQMLKAKPGYWVLVKMKHDTHLYKVLDNHFGELDLYIELDEPDYFQNLYKHGKKRKSEISIRMGC